MSAPSTPQNPYPVGLRLSEEDREFLEAAVAVFNKAAEQQGRHDILSKGHDMRMRIKQCMVHGSGLTQEHREILEFHSKRAIEEFMNGQMPPEELERRIMGVYSQFLTSAIRLEPDPARFLAEYVISSLQEQKASLAKNLISNVFAEFRNTLDDLRQLYEQDGWPSGEQVMEYLLQAVDHEIRRSASEEQSASS